MPIYSYNDQTPNIGANCFIAPNASVIGNVTIGNNCSVWFGAVIRGDTNSITIGDNTNIQDNSIVHCNTNKPTTIGKNVTLGHGVLVHACDIGDGALIGNKSVIHDKAIIGEESLVAPGAVVTDRTEIPPRTLVMGIPAKMKRHLNEEDLERMKGNNQRYLKLKDDYLTNFEQL